MKDERSSYKDVHRARCAELTPRESEIGARRRSFNCECALHWLLRRKEEPAVLNGLDGSFGSALNYTLNRLKRRRWHQAGGWSSLLPFTLRICGFPVIRIVR